MTLPTRKRKSSIGDSTGYISRERGSQDWRLLPCALVLWLSELLSQRLWDRYLSTTYTARQAAQLTRQQGPATQLSSYWLPIALSVLTLVIAVGTVAVLVIRSERKHPLQLPCSRVIRQLGPMVLLTLACALLGACASALNCLHTDTDYATLSALSGPVPVQAQVVALSPTMGSERFGSDCRTDVSIRQVSASGLTVPSSSSARVYASGSDCVMQQSGLYQVSGKLSLSAFGSAPVWLQAGQSHHSSATQAGERQPSVRELRAPKPVPSVLTAMQTAFLTLTDNLDDQGQVLVPGLTLGVLGQESYITCPTGSDSSAEHAGSHSCGLSGKDRVVPAYASKLKEDFTKSGIIHLMAVSGGHFLLLAMLVRRTVRALRGPRWLESIALIAAYWFLASMMYPSDSLLRAEVMGILAAVSLMLGRRSQSISSLSITVVAVLVVRPSMATSFGFALSCSAVLGISVAGRPLAQALSEHMPAFLADSLAITGSAQLGTLPIQVLMSSQIPLLSLPANVVVAPFVDAATVCGLAGLLVAAWQPQVATVLIWLASRGTLLMEKTARWLGSPSWSTLPWPGGVLGCLAVLILEVCLLCLYMSLRALSKLRHTCTQMPGQNVTDSDLEVSGRAYRVTLAQRLELWCQQTWGQLSSLDYSGRNEHQKTFVHR